MDSINACQGANLYILILHREPMERVRSVLALLRYSTGLHLFGFFVIGNISWGLRPFYQVLAVVDWLLLGALVIVVMQETGIQVSVVAGFVAFSVVSLPQRLLFPINMIPATFLPDFGIDSYFIFSGLSAVAFGVLLLVLIKHIEAHLSFYSDIDRVLAVLFILFGLITIGLVVTYREFSLPAMTIVFVLKFFVLPTMGIYQYQVLVERLDQMEHDEVPDLYPQ